MHTSALAMLPVALAEWAVTVAHTHIHALLHNITCTSHRCTCMHKATMPSHVYIPLTLYIVMYVYNSDPSEIQFQTTIEKTIATAHLEKFLGENVC